MCTSYALSCALLVCTSTWYAFFVLSCDLGGQHTCVPGGCFTTSVSPCKCNNVPGGQLPEGLGPDSTLAEILATLEKGGDAAASATDALTEYLVSKPGNAADVTNLEQV